MVIIIIIIQYIYIILIILKITQTDKSCSLFPGPGRELSSLCSHQSSWGRGRAEGLAALPCTQLRNPPLLLSLSAKLAKDSGSPVPPHCCAGW